MIPDTVAAAARHMLRRLFFVPMGTRLRHYRRYRGYFNFCPSTMAYHCDLFQFPGASKRAERKQTSSVLCREKLYDYQRGKYS